MIQLSADALNIFLGVISGVITAMLFYVGSRFVEHTIKPWAKQVRYDGVDIEGVWIDRDSDAVTSTTSETTLTLDQSARDVRGTYSLRFRSPSNSFDLHMTVSGELWEGYVSLTMRPVDRTVTSVSTALFKVDGGGVSLRGVMAFRNVNSDKVETMPVNLMRGHSPHVLPPAPPPSPTTAANASVPVVPTGAVLPAPPPGP
jgi:hypothetical protein